MSTAVFDATKVIDNLYIGSKDACNQLPRLQNIKVHGIVNATKDIPNYHDTLSYLRVPIDDCEQTNIYEYFSSCATFIKRVIHEKKGACLVHCMAGMSRSATLVIAYLMKVEKYDLRAAYLKLLHARPIIRPNNYFMSQLCEYEMYLFNKSTMNVSDLKDTKLVMKFDHPEFHFQPIEQPKRNETMVKMQLRFSKGNSKRICLTMYANQTIKDLRQTIERSCPGMSNAYQLIVPYPRTVLCENEMTLQEAKLNNCIVNVQFMT